MKNTLVWLALGASACGKSEPTPAPTPAAEVTPAPDAAPAPDVAAAPDVAPVPAGPPQLFRGKIDVGGGVSITADITLTGATGTMDIPMQQLKGGPLTEVVATADVVSFVFSPPGAPPGTAVKFSAKKDGDTFVGEVEQPGAKLPLTLTPIDAKDGFARKRPQTPQPPFPYKNELVEVKSGDFTLGCTLSLPEGEGPFPAVVFFTGSGAQDRDETLFEHKPFLVIGDALVRSGVGTLRCDDRSVGESKGDFAGADINDFVVDGKAMIAYLEGRKEIAKDHIGALGHSQGGMVAAELAKAGDIDFAVLVAGPALSGREVSVRQNLDAIVAQGVPPAETKALQEALEALFQGMADDLPAVDLQARIQKLAEAVIASRKDGPAIPLERIMAQFEPLTKNRWMLSWVKSKPAEVLAQVKLPVLALYGEKDTQVHGAEHAAALKAAYEAAKNTHGEVELVPGANHLFQPATTGNLSEYEEIELTIMPSVLERITTWVGKVTK